MSAEADGEILSLSSTRKYFAHGTAFSVLLKKLNCFQLCSCTILAENVAPRATSRLVKNNPQTLIWYIGFIGYDINFATFEVPTLTINNFKEAIQQESIDFTDFST